MKTTALFLLIATLFFCSKTSQAQNLEWARHMGGISNDFGTKSIMDDSGNVYLTGYFNGVVDMDPSSNMFKLTSSGGRDIFVNKLDKSGNLVWSNKFGGSGNDNGMAINIDSLGYIYVTGYFSNTVDFNPGVGTHNLYAQGNNDIFVLKLDANGGFKWAKSMGGSSLDWGFSIDVDNVGNVYTAGWFEGTCDFDPGASTYYQSAVDQNIFISKLDSNGKFVWARTFGSGGIDNACYVYIDQLYNVLLTGDFAGTVDFDPGAGNHYLTANTASSDAFLLKLDSNGDFSWAKSFGGSGNDRSHTVVMDTAFDIYLTGYFWGNVDFDPSTSSNYNLTALGGQDAFVSKFDSSGNFIWARNFSGASNERGRDLCTDISGNVYITGKFSDSVDFDPGNATHFLKSTMGSEDIYMAKLDTKGDFIWAWKFGEYFDDYCNSIGVDSDFNIYLTGGFGDSVDFAIDTNSSYKLTSYGGMDIFMAKFSQCDNSSSVISAEVCESYVSPSGKYIWKVSGTYKDTIQNAKGCDSLITIGLLVHYDNSSVIFKTACDSLVSPSKKYTWTVSGTYTDTISTIHGCDSTIIIGLTIQNSFRDTISVSSCGSYQSPSGKHVWSVSGTYKDTIMSNAACDSTYVINLTIDTVDVLVHVTGNLSLKANALGAIYQWVDCNNSFSPISGKTHQSFIASKSGSYAVVVWQFNCVDTSSCYQLINTGLEDDAGKVIFTYYPNPASSSLFVQSSTIGNLRLFNTSGQMVYQEEVNIHEKRIDLGSLANGMYIIQFIDEHNNYIDKLLIAK